MRTFVPNEPTVTPVKAPCLTVSQHGKPPSVVPLADGASVYAGSAASCGIHISGENVAQFQCLFTMNEGRLWIQDCHTGGELFVNGATIDCETVLNHGDEVTIGAHQITAVLAQCHFPAASISTESPSPESLSELDPVPPRAIESIDDDRSPSPELNPDAREYFDQLIHELDEEADSSAPATAYGVGTDEAECESSYESAYQTSDFGAEELDLLRDEVAQLQNELAERDAELRRLREAPFDSDDESAAGNSEDVVRLVTRLEELLDELQKSDGRILALEELLRVSDVAKQAEQEERQQLESWVNEIEQRIALRESEMDAEVQRLQAQNEELKGQLQKSETNARAIVKSASAPTAASTASRELLQNLRDRCDELERRLESASGEADKLRGELKSQAQSADEVRRQLEQKLAEQDLKVSRERAEVARNRAELERTRDDFERGVGGGEHTDTDTRFIAMRQHLRELHAQEETEREQKRQRSLSGRIASLLGRVGGR